MNNTNSNKHHSRSNNNSKGILEQILETLKEIKLALTKHTDGRGGAEGESGMSGHGNQGTETKRTDGKGLTF